MSKFSVFLAEEDDVIRLGHRHIIEKSPQFEFSGESDCLEQIVQSVERLKPTIVVLSWTLTPELLDLSRRVLRVPERPHILLALSNPQDFFPALRTYSRGYILKQTQSWVFPVALDALARGVCFIEPFIAGYLLEGDGRFHLNGYNQASFHSDSVSQTMLTPKEKKVMHLLSDGLSNPDIATSLRISVETVRVHLKNIYRKLGVTKRDEAISRMKQIVSASDLRSSVETRSSSANSERQP